MENAEVVGIIEVGGEEKQIRILEERGLSAELLVPLRSWSPPTKYSRIQIRFDGRKVLEVRWDRAGAFKAIHFEPGDWERALIDLPAPIPF